MNELAEMFAAVCRKDDVLYLLPVYDVGGTADRSVNSDLLARLLKDKGVCVVEVQSHEDAVRRISADVRAGDIVATLGARDPELPLTARRII